MKIAMVDKRRSTTTWMAVTTIMMKEKMMVRIVSLMLATKDVLTPRLWNRLSLCMRVTTPKAKAAKEMVAFATVVGTEKNIVELNF